MLFVQQCIIIIGTSFYPGFIFIEVTVHGNIDGSPVIYRSHSKLVTKPRFGYCCSKTVCIRLSFKIGPGKLSVTIIINGIAIKVGFIALPLQVYHHLRFNRNSRKKKEENEEIFNHINYGYNPKTTALL
jgi:hypothetical protein